MTFSDWKQDQRIKAKIVEVGKKLTRQGVVGTNEGNLSVIDRERHRIFVTPSGREKESLTPKQILTIREDGSYICREKGFKSSSETSMHLRLYRMRPDVSACLHCHSPFATAFAVNHEPIRSDAMAEMLLLFGGEIPLLPFGMLGTEHIIDGYENHLNKDVFLLANHGLVSVGKTLDEAYGKAITAEMVAKTLFLSRMMGKNASIPQEQMEEFALWSVRQQQRD